MSADTYLDDLRTCVHCGMCLPACPTYRVAGEELSSPRGRIYLMRAVAEGRAEASEEMARNIDTCLGCRACETACPSKVPYGSLLETTRARLSNGVRATGTNRILDLALEMLPHPDRMAPLMATARGLQKIGAQQLARRLGLVSALGLSDIDAMLPPLSPPAKLSAVIHARGEKRGTAGLHIGCVQRFLLPGVNADTATALAHAGFEVRVPEQGCCGALHMHAGRPEPVAQMARDLASAFAGVDFIVSNAAGCGSTMKEIHHTVEGGDMPAFAARVRDVSEVLVDADMTLAAIPERVAYHDPCHLLHAQRIREAPRKLLSRVPELVLVELEDAGTCCGSAGLYSMLEPDIARSLVQRKVDAIRASGARILATGNPGCMLHIAQECRAQGFDIEVVHPVTLIARSISAFQ